MSINNLYHRFIMFKSVPFYLTISDSDLAKLKTISKNNSFVTAEDYIISCIDSNYECIETRNIFDIKNSSIGFDRNKHILKEHDLKNPKLLKYKNNICNIRQLSLDDYLNE